MRTLLLLGVLAVTARSDEGMWLLNAPPAAHLKAKYGFDLTPAWLERAMKGSVRFNNGGSGGFVSPDGLIVTNHHIAADALQKLGTKERDLYRDGFLAKTRGAELKCPDLELNVLQSIEDVTDRVNKASDGAKDPAGARRAVMAAVEKESLDATGLRSDVVTLYQGGQYHLYRYKKYTDVRLVFAPERAIAGFGGDVDNFEFPRFNLDVAFFRAYENGTPAKVTHFFRWSEVGPAENDLVFVTGHPGTTNRLETVARLEFRRDRGHPYTLNRLRTLEAALTQYAETSPESRRRAATDLHRVANARKAFAGQYQGLLDPGVIAGKKTSEASLVAEPGAAKGTTDVIAAAVKDHAALEPRYSLMETGHAFGSELFAVARHLVRLGDELPKPSGDRLREYRDSNLDSLKFQLFSPAPIYADLERVKLAASLAFAAEQLGGADPAVLQLLAGKNPANRAAELVAESKLADPAERKKLFEGGKNAVAASPDPLIQLARQIDAASRQLRADYETKVEEPERRGYAALAKLRFAAAGTAMPPDATFTLRLAFGTVRGYEADGAAVPPFTTFGGAFARADAMLNREPFDLPQRWADARSKFPADAPFNFCSTADTIGGNSGSPVLNRAGELVGINFDRNRHGLVRNFAYTDVQARHIAVHAKGVIVALETLYDAGALLAELRGK